MLVSYSWATGILSLSLVYETHKNLTPKSPNRSRGESPVSTLIGKSVFLSAFSPVQFAGHCSGYLSKGVQADAFKPFPQPGWC